MRAHYVPTDLFKPVFLWLFLSITKRPLISVYSLKLQQLSPEWTTWRDKFKSCHRHNAVFTAITVKNRAIGTSEFVSVTSM